MSTWYHKFSKNLSSKAHKEEGCKFLPWLEGDGVFMYAICFTCNKKITPDEWHKWHAERQVAV